MAYELGQPLSVLMDEPIEYLNIMIGYKAQLKHGQERREEKLEQAKMQLMKLRRTGKKDGV